MKNKTALKEIFFASLLSGIAGGIIFLIVLRLHVDPVFETLPIPVTVLAAIYFSAKQKSVTALTAPLVFISVFIAVMVFCSFIFVDSFISNHFSKENVRPISQGDWRGIVIPLIISTVIALFSSLLIGGFRMLQARARKVGH